MFSKRLLACLSAGVCSLILSSITLAQAPPESSAKAEAATSLPSTQTLPRNYPVITVKGDCSSRAAKTKSPTANCSTIITRDQFEDLVNSINPQMIKRERKQLAENYAKMLALSQVALRKGLDRGDRVKALIRYVDTGALGGAAYKDLLRENSAVSSADIEKFYTEKKGDFERFNFQRIYVPLEPNRTSVALQDAAKEQEQAPPPGPDMKQLAAEIQSRAASGEDFAALQKSVMQSAGLQGDPDVVLQDMLRGVLPQEHDKAFDLKPGAVSPVVADASGYYIYKLISTNNPPLDEIRPQVLLRLQTERMAEVLKRVEEHSKVNEQYFQKYDPPAADPNEPEVDDD
jgi:parvulin-like peptidyl-prolyl isomerase